MTMPHEPSDELLDYEAEQDDEPGPLFPEPVPIRACEPVITVPTVPQHVTFQTIVLTADEPVQRILDRDPLRVRALLMLADANDVVLSHTIQQAQSAQNVAANLPTPAGAIVPHGLATPVELTGTQSVWASAATYPTRIGLVVERRTP